MNDVGIKNGIRIAHLRLAGSAGRDRSYDVEFTKDRQWRPLSVIAGPSQTGKTSIVEYVLYCLGDNDFPQHQEMVSTVRAALLGIETDGDAKTIERSTTGNVSSFASVWDAPISAVGEADETRVPVEPPSDPMGLSQLLLQACDLDNVRLPVAPTKDESDAHILSMRDLFRIMWLSNDRLDNKNLVFEQSHFMVRQKFLQTIDVMFGVHDGDGADLAQRAKVAAEAAKAAERDSRTYRALAEEEYPLGSMAMAADLEELLAEKEFIDQTLTSLDQAEVQKQSSVAGLRDQYMTAQRASKSASLRVRNRTSLLDRLAALRGQYADDKRKLTFLTEAEKLFDPLNVQHCPACLAALEVLPSVSDADQCTLCGSMVHQSDSGPLHLGAALEAADERGQDASDVQTPLVLQAELRAVDRRLKELTDYWGRLNQDLTVLESAALDAQSAEEGAEIALEESVSLPAPFLAQRDALGSRRQDVGLRIQSLGTGLRMWARSARADERAEQMRGHAAALRAERRDANRRPDRESVVQLLSVRFASILKDFGYPKLDLPYLGNDLTPHVRGLPYTKASSGGMVLISLAFYLSIWEVAHEEGASAPGLLIIDSPQKNLGHKAASGDSDFADAALVENFYSHVRNWLSTDGQGAQLIVVDNSPPESVDDDVIIRFTRDPENPPYGLVADAVD